MATTFTAIPMILADRVSMRHMNLGLSTVLLLGSLSAFALLSMPSLIRAFTVFSGIRAAQTVLAFDVALAVLALAANLIGCSLEIRS